MLVNMPDQVHEPARNEQRAPGAGDIGARVSIRVRDQEPGKFRDVLGHLVDLSHVRDKNGTIKEFDPHLIVAWKRVES